MLTKFYHYFIVVTSKKINIRLKEKRQKLSGKNKVKIEWYKKSKIIKKVLQNLNISNIMQF